MERPRQVEAPLRREAGWLEHLRHGQAASSLLIETADHGDVTLIALSGELDIYTAAVCQRELEAHDPPGASQLVVDLTQVGFLDSSGLSVLVCLRNRLERAGDRLGLVCPRRLEAILRAAGLVSAFVLGEDLAGVRTALAKRTPALPGRTATPSRAASSSPGAQAAQVLGSEVWLG